MSKDEHEKKAKKQAKKARQAQKAALEAVRAKYVPGDDQDDIEEPDHYKEEPKDVKKTPKKNKKEKKASFASTETENGKQSNNPYEVLHSLENGNGMHDTAQDMEDMNINKSTTKTQLERRKNSSKFAGVNVNTAIEYKLHYDQLRYEYNNGDHLAKAKAITQLTYMLDHPDLTDYRRAIINLHLAKKFEVNTKRKLSHLAACNAALRNWYESHTWPPEALPTIHLMATQATSLAFYLTTEALKMKFEDGSCKVFMEPGMEGLEVASDLEDVQMDLGVWEMSEKKYLIDTLDFNFLALTDAAE